MSLPSHSFDALIVGAGTAGLSAALVLGRSRVKTLLLDSGKPRNAPTLHAHSFLTREGTSPTEMLRIGREQLAPYESVLVHDEAAMTITVLEEGFEVVSERGERWSARKLVLATGLIDELPPVDGFRERWGVSVLHCPFCHGWEVRDQTLIVYGNGPSAYEMCLLASGWSNRITLCTDGPSNLTAEQLTGLSRNGIQILETPVARVEGEGLRLERLVFADGGALPCDALFVRSIRQQRSGLAAELGCQVTDAGFIWVDDMGQTSVTGAYAAGDAIEPNMQILTFAAYSGARAGIGVTKALIKESFEGGAFT